MAVSPSVLPFRDINVHAAPSHYAFLSPSSSGSPALVVDRPSGDIRLHDGSLSGAKRISSIAGILGIIKLRLDKYIIVITKAQPVSRIKGHMIYKVAATEFLPLRERQLHDHDEDVYVKLVKATLENAPLYFSYSYDLTNSLQRQSRSDVSTPFWKQADDRFFWNRFLQSDLIDFRTGLGYGGRQTAQRPGADPFILPVVFGTMIIRQTSIKGTPFTFAIITRRSRFRVGTRYFSRGIDADGHVSNFNETEQLIIFNDPTGKMSAFGGNAQDGKGGDREIQAFSYIQTRGSVPAYWAEINNLGYTPKLGIKPVHGSLGAARKHFDEQISIYGDNFLVNLVNQKGREDRVKKAYEETVRLLISTPAETKESDAITSEKLHEIEPAVRHQKYDRLHYVYFDFHNETKGLKWHRAKILLDRLSPDLDRQRYFYGIDTPSDGHMEVKTEQTSVVRTNCMDCLDRTNVVQSMLGREAVNRMLRDVGILRAGEDANDDKAFEDMFRNAWADNADIVSKAYSGTGALKTDFTRTGERTKAGALQDFSNSSTRYFKNNFADGPRQDGFDLVLGAFMPPDASSAVQLLFVDRRPLLIQAIPYILAMSVFLVLVSVFTPKAPESAILPIRIFITVWFAIGVWCLQFIFKHGMLYVNWPKLNPPAFAQDGFNEALSGARKDKVIGSFVARHERGASTARLSYAEEGKKRVE